MKDSAAWAVNHFGDELERLARGVGFEGSATDLIDYILRVWNENSFDKFLLKSLLVANDALENARPKVQRYGSEDDAMLNHDALFHLKYCISKLESER